MVSRTSVRDAGRRAQQTLSRGTLRKTNSKTLWNELHIDVMKGETATDVEHVESYGSTSYPADQDEDEDKGQSQPQDSGGGGEAGGAGGGSPGKVGEQPEGDAAEPIIAYMNGSRSHPVVLAVGDRRHRLLELEQGDVAQHRLKDDRQQMLFSKDGTYISTREDKTFRVALVPKEAKDQAQGQEQGAGGGEAQQGKKKKTHGQKSAKPDNQKSDVNIEQTSNESHVQHQQAFAAMRSGDATAYHTDRKHSAQATKDHSHIRTMDNRIFTDEQGCWSETPIQVKKDRYCKE